MHVAILAYRRHEIEQTIMKNIKLVNNHYRLTFIHFVRHHGQYNIFAHSLKALMFY